MIKWNKIKNGYTWEAMMQTLLFFIDSGMRIYTREGKDFAIDAFSPDGKTVYQAKYHKEPTIDKAIADLKSEFKKIKKYRSEKDFWKPVEIWILFTNVDINGNDEQKWNKTTSNIDTDGIQVTLWHWGIIKSELISHPPVIKSYFENELRVFTTFSEEIGKQREQAWFTKALDVEFVGREDALSNFDSFLSSDKKVWGITGPGGMGKSRFLLECGKRADSEWHIYWSTSESLKRSNILESIIPEHRTLLFIDELEDVDLLTKTLLIELSSGRMKNWKVIFTERNNIALTIRELELPKYNDIRFTQHILSKLNDEDSEKLIRSLLKEIDIEKKGFYFTDIEHTVQKIRILSMGIPLWIALSIRLIEEDMSLKEIPKSAEKLLRKYTDFILPELDSINISKEKYFLIRNWIALYGKVNVEDKEVIKFIAKESDVKKSDFVTLINLMVDCGLAIRIGANKRFAIIAPDSIRDQILIDALIDCDEITTFAKYVIAKMLNEEIPSKELILHNLAIVEILQNFQKDASLLDPILKKIILQTKEGTLINQRSSIELIQHIEYARPGEAIEILKTCWENVLDDYVQSNEFWGEIRLTHKDIRAKIPWALFGIAKYCKIIELQKELIDFYFMLIEYEIEAGQKVVNSEGAQSLLTRTLFEENWSDIYKSIACREADRIFEIIEKKGNINNIETVFFDILLEGLLKVEKRILGSYKTGSINIKDFRITPLNSGWKTIEKYKEKIKELLAKTNLSPELLLLITKHYSGLFPQVNGITRLENYELNEDLLESREFFFKTEFNWIINYLKNEENGRCYEARYILKKTWNWHLECSENDELKYLAEECESTYFIDTEEHRIFNWLKENYRYNNKNVKDDDYFFHNYIYGKSPDDILSFLLMVDHLKLNKNKHKVYSLGETLSKFIESNDDFQKIIDKGLTTNVDSYQWEFVFAIIHAFHKKLREEDKISFAQTHLRTCIDNILSRANFIYRYYLYITQKSIVDLADVKIIEDKKDEFQKNPESYVHLLALFTYSLYDYMADYIDINWESFSEDCKTNYLESLVRIHRTGLNVYEWDNKKRDWLLDKLINLEDIDWLENYNHHLEKEIGVKGIKNVIWYLDLLKERISNVKNENLFSISFSFKFFVTPDFTKAEEVKAFSQIIDFVHFEYPIGYYIPKYIAEIDPNNKVLSKLVCDKFKSVRSNEEKYQLARIAGEFKRNTSAWDDISKVVCEYAITQDSDTCSRFYSEINWIGITDCSHMYGQVSYYYYNCVNEAEEAIENDKCEARREYWKKELENAQEELRLAEEKAKEIRGE